MPGHSGLPSSGALDLVLAWLLGLSRFILLAASRSALIAFSDRRTVSSILLQMRARVRVRLRKITLSFLLRAVGMFKLP